MDSINTIGPAKSISNGAYLYDITFDNLNQKVHVRHHRKGAHTQQLNMVQAFATRDRVPSGHLSDTEPTANDVRNITTEQFLPNQKDEEDLKEEIGQEMDQKADLGAETGGMAWWTLSQEEIQL